MTDSSRHMRAAGSCVAAKAKKYGKVLSKKDQNSPVSF